MDRRRPGGWDGGVSADVKNTRAPGRRPGSRCGRRRSENRRRTWSWRRRLASVWAANVVVRRSRTRSLDLAAARKVSPSRFLDLTRQETWACRRRHLFV